MTRNQQRAAVGVCVAALGASAFLFRGEKEIQEVEPQEDHTASLPSPVAEELPQPPIRFRSVVETKAAATAKVEKEGWAVVVATYRDYDAADRRARSLGIDSKFQPGVFPPKGEGSMYQVVLASGITQAQAKEIRDEATAAGLPADTYVTKLSTGE